MKIPKIIHQIWIGPNKPPEFIHTWKDNHPDYEYILWNEEKINKEMYPLINQHLYDQYDNEKQNVWNGKANLLRLEILKKYGGIYVDADCKSLRRMEGKFLQSEFFAVYVNEKLRGNRLNNNVIGCISEHPIINECINRLNKYKKISQPSFIFSGPVFLTEVVNDLNISIIKLPSYYFSPNFFKNEGNYNGDFKPFADHMWGTIKNLYNKI